MMWLQVPNPSTTGAVRILFLAMPGGFFCVACFLGLVFLAISGPNFWILLAVSRLNVTPYSKYSSMNLFSPIVNEKRFHPTFANVLAKQNVWEEKIVTDWAEGFEDRDGKFVKEFQTTFDSSFWELYLHAVLRDRGCEVDFSSARPDFCVRAPFEFTLEATVALHAQGSRAATEMPTEAELRDISTLNHQAILRLTNSIASKQRKFRESYSKLDHVKDKPFVLAVAPFDRPGFTLQVNRAIEAVLFGHYVDESLDSREDLILFGPPVFDISSVKKTEQSSVDVGLFMTPAHSEISAVVFSTLATWSKVSALSEEPAGNVVFDTLHYNPKDRSPNRSRHPKKDHREHLLDGLRVYHNPHADHPLPIGLFEDERVFQTYYDHNSDEWIYQTSEQNLLFRSSTRYVTKSEQEAIIARLPKHLRPTVQPGGQGEGLS
ncbi:hypothetical protein V2O64_18745 [Verrucomicrobiaceae bacterium 227]